MTKVAPSILSADFGYLMEEIRKTEEGGADYLHIDVMDGNYVPNITVGVPVISRLKGRTKLPFDVHLMITNAETLVDDFIEAGADILTVHVEAVTHLQRLLARIRDRGVMPAVALNPSTPIDTLTYVLDDIDMVLLMTVNPGFGGQRFIPQMLNKIRDLKAMIASHGKDILIEIDGGVTVENARQIAKAGADILVAGSAVYNSADIGEAIAKLKGKK